MKCYLRPIIFGNYPMQELVEILQHIRSKKRLCQPNPWRRPDASATDFMYDTDMMNMKSSGGPLQQDRYFGMHEILVIADTNNNNQCWIFI